MAETEEKFIELEDHLTQHRRINETIRRMNEDARFELKPICNTCMAVDREMGELHSDWRYYECTEFMKEDNGKKITNPEPYFDKKTRELKGKHFYYTCKGREELKKLADGSKKRVINKHKIALYIEKEDLEKLEGKKK